MYDAEGRDKRVRMWRAVGGERLLTELQRSMFSCEDDFQTAIAFHHERGCELESDVRAERVTDPAGQ
jgi:hypothetical protein